MSLRASLSPKDSESTAGQKRALFTTLVFTTLVIALVGCANGVLSTPRWAWAAEAEKAVTDTPGSGSTEVGTKGEVTIDVDSLLQGEQEPNFSAKLIKTLNLDKLLRGKSVLTGPDEQPLSLEELLAQKLQRLAAKDGEGDLAAKGDSTAGSATGNKTDVSALAREGAQSAEGVAVDNPGDSANSVPANIADQDSSHLDAADTFDIDPEAAADLEAQGEETALFKTLLYDTGILDINDTYVEYVDGFLASEAPEQGAALWAGSDATFDGFLGYFIGHNPGDFTPVLSLQIGDPITVYDRYGDERTYHVVDTFVVPNTSRFIDIEERLFGYGESIALQTCLDDNQNFLIVVAA